MVIGRLTVSSSVIFMNSLREKVYSWSEFQILIRNRFLSGVSSNKDVSFLVRIVCTWAQNNYKGITAVMHQCYWFTVTLVLQGVADNFFNTSLLSWIIRSQIGWKGIVKWNKNEGPPYNTEKPWFQGTLLYRTLKSLQNIISRACIFLCRNVI